MIIVAMVCELNLWKIRAIMGECVIGTNAVDETTLSLLHERLRLAFVRPYSL